MTRPTQIGRTFPLISATALGGTGGAVDGTQPDGQYPGSGQVPTSSGSNGWAWASNVAVITSNTSNALVGPFVNVNSGSGVTFAVASNTLTISASGSAGSSLPWFFVTDYGATGDGTTDDTSAVNSAIAALNAAGRGVLYFPAGTYKATSALTSITVPATVLGDGAGLSGSGGSTVTCTSNTAALFTVGTNGITFRGLRLLNTGGSESAGSAIAVVTGAGTSCRYEDLWVEGFYDGLSLIYGFQWAMDNCEITNPVRYGVRIANVDLPDGGDWSMSNTWFGTRSRNATAAIRQESAGGGKLVNVKINQNTVADQSTYGGVKRFTTGHHVYIDGATNSTSVLTYAGVSVENVSGDAVHLQTNGTGVFHLVTINSLQVGLYSNNTGRAVKVSAAAAGGLGTPGALVGVVIDGCVFRTDGTARAAIELTNTDRVTLGDIQLVSNFTSRYTSSGDTNTTDGTGVTDHGALTGLADDDHSQYVLRSILTTKGDLFARTTSHITRVAAGSNTGMALVTDLNYVEGVRWGNTVGEILISDTPAGSPLVFSDLVQNEAQDDLMYADP